jgi:hypothetical protein
VFIAIFHHLQCVFLIFDDFQFSCHIPGPTVFFSHFPWFSDFCLFVFSHILGPTVYNSYFPRFWVFLAIFQVLQCFSSILHVFLFFPHIPGPTVCISHFSPFSVISSFFTS